MTTRWSPDTCDCVFDVADDWKSATAIIRTCSVHKGQQDPFVAVRNENAFKNMVVGYVTDNYPDHGYGGHFSYDDGPTAPLNLHVPSTLSTDQVKALAADLDNHFGTGVVVVVADQGAAAA